MTPPQIGSLLKAVKRCRWDPVRGVEMFARRNPNVPLTPEVYGYAVAVGRTPYPEDKRRPWHDTRMWQGPEQKAWQEDEAKLGGGVNDART